MFWSFIETIQFREGLRGIYVMFKLLSRREDTFSLFLVERASRDWIVSNFCFVTEGGRIRWQLHPQSSAGKMPLQDGCEPFVSCLLRMQNERFWTPRQNHPSSEHLEVWERFDYHNDWGACYFQLLRSRREEKMSSTNFVPFKMPIGPRWLFFPSSGDTGRLYAILLPEGLRT